VVLKLLFISWLIVMTIQDFKYRAIVWYAFPIGFIIIASYGLNQSDYGQLYRNILINAGFVTFQLAMVTVYYTLKNKKFTNIFKKHIGIGDLLFLMLITPAFSPGNFIVFIMLSNFITLLSAFIFILFRELKQIPLAGAMASILFFVLIVSLFFDFDLYSDQWILNWLA